MSNPFYPKQRWFSELEPELGMGVVLEVALRDVILQFPVTQEQRRYRIQNAPLKRVRYKAGDRVVDKNGNSFLVESVQQTQGLHLLKHHVGFLKEEDLSFQGGESGPETRFLSNQLGHFKDYMLRQKTLHLRHQALMSPVRGLMGPRVELLPHQVYIANQSANTEFPRWLLADEVGLGKTIEAGLIFHKMHVLGQAERVLVLTPRSLANQWLIELYRKFHTMFTVLEGESDKPLPEENVFLSAQTFIAPQEWLLQNSESLQQACELDWDLIIIDEAHHISWSTQGASKEYQALQQLVTKSKGLLLLTATPTQMGTETYFGSLHLLDPERFPSYSSFTSESQKLPAINTLVQGILHQESPSILKAYAQKYFPQNKPLLNKLESYLKGDIENQEILHFLIDQHGTGRMVFRNQRSVLSGFPKRTLRRVSLEPVAEYKVFYQEALNHLLWDTPYLGWDPLAMTPANLNLPREESVRVLKALWYQDPRILWLRDFLKSLPKTEKVLVICNSLQKVLAFQDIFPTLSSQPFVTFHEKMPLNKRDKQAADFSRPEGVQFLISSEIGSEGRNFQFSNKLVLFDLPENPGLLEQRIGRLHRIGQKRDVEIYVPMLPNHPMNIIADWYHQGLHAFTSPTMGAESIMEKHRATLEAHAKAIVTSQKIASIDTLLEATQQDMLFLQQNLEHGRDSLLELHSFQADTAQECIVDIQKREASLELEYYLEELCASYGIDWNPSVETRGHIIYPGEEMTVRSFPGLPPSGLAVTLDRTQALTREDLHFLTWEHPFVLGGMDFVLGEQNNTTCIMEWHGAPQQGLAIEFTYILEPLKAPHLNLWKYCPPTPMSFLLDHNGQLQEAWSSLLPTARLVKGPTSWLHGQQEFKENVFPTLLKNSEHVRDLLADGIKKKAQQQVKVFFEKESTRLSQMIPSPQNEAVGKELKIVCGELLQHIQDAPVRLDSLRLLLMETE
jgi:ATP-dependent helicase HepA